MLWESSLPARYLAARSLVRRGTIEPVNMYSRFFEYFRRDLFCLLQYFGGNARIVENRDRDAWAFLRQVLGSRCCI
jgi:hypothetical protein